MTYLLAILAGVVGALLGGALAAALAMLIGSRMGVSSFEGQLGMFAVFAAGPLGALIGLILGVWLVLRRRGRSTAAELAWRLPVVVLAIAGLAAGGLWLFYESRPGLGTSSSGPPRLDFEIRLPPRTPVGDRIRIELSTERNRMPGTIFARKMRHEGDRPVIAGSVDLHYRSSWRLLELVLVPDGEAQIFNLRLASRPGHMSDFAAWRPVDHIARGGDQPRPASASDAFEIRTRVVYPDAEHKESSPRP